VSAPATRQSLLDRLDAIARAVAERPGGLALLGLGSCADVGRLDASSDLDFFVIVADGRKRAWLDALDWLGSACPLVWTHPNTPDGFKTLDADGVLSEFAVFEAGELAGIPFAPGRIVWAREGFDTGALAPRRGPDPVNPAWEAAEARSNLLVGLSRLARGEAASAWECVCVHAAGHALRAVAQGRAEGGDPFNPLRRLEARDAGLARTVARWRGPDVAQAAAAIALALDESFGEDAMSTAIAARLRAPIEGAS
jgi:hypothetical protein